MKNLIILPVLLMFLVLSCDDDTSQKEQYSPFEDPITTDKIDFDGDGRIYYTISAYGHPDEISSSRWTEPDLDIDENLWDMGQGKIHTETGLLVPDFNVLAAYCSSATPLITLYPGWRAETAIAPGTYSIQGVLLDATGTALPLFDASGDLEIDGTDYLPIDV
ncbi:hypothetical protein KKF84_22325, partial [Myxococcota bacterium]|nr:hypothetical protein [Myxococcota bacterium]